MEGSLSLTTNFVLRTILHILYVIQQFKILPQKSWLLNMECISNKIGTSFKDGKESEMMEQYFSLKYFSNSYFFKSAPHVLEEKYDGHFLYLESSS